MDIFYDFDGTLFDTYPAMVAALVQTAVDYQVKIDRNQAYQQMRQGSLGDAIKVLARVAKVESTTIEHHFRAIENEELKNSRPFEGVKVMLESVVNHGGKNYLLTHRNQAAITLLEKFEMKTWFEDFVTGDMTFPRKPNPASLNYLIERNQVNKKTAYMIGDRNLDIDAAHNADIKGILFDPDQIINVTSHPELITNNFKDIQTYLDKKLINP
ncbi:HAD-IA family hydrolase [Pediococcus pentosaceus]|uniref:HAD-IA family hydrolase n=1 Tax=Pediococcus pentosaceus TaxID=1255 RepID=UPI0027E54F98|nr:HAD-IA family hydrolase [Pediococcus pentosaceus]MDQ7251818.1 HAD-IA family hydrolase [Pediococcus pentosaceus]